MRYSVSITAVQLIRVCVGVSFAEMTEQSNSGGGEKDPPDKWKL